MNDSDSPNSPGEGSAGSDDASTAVPYAGVATTDEAADNLEAVSSKIYQYAGVPGKASEPGPGVRECAGKDPERFFRVFHPWNFQPGSAADSDVAMENLKKRLNTGGWVLKKEYRDNSENENLNLVADNESEKASVWIVQYRDRAKPSLGITVTSGCYEVPEGAKVEKF
ncbi:hypothetical protein ACIGZI_29790 [Streptomyces griseus]|uniref:hypothetical protein n=1 Tax=Streptomyces TaxID=1883 RepID=UPI00081B0C73|nr:hypothetical protein [Streptomyces sp. OspMP-M43]SCD43351.1 hypothetical protein GA0115261_100403 [Streptomyces sp. OspMP-M43]